jgi:7,8-dihydropterin-6-yl-methyl-4-(beta-D-ribofuranosyl)aminobenzene 5'-phosphate synthase
MTTIQILCDNNIGRMDFLGEHGFSALIEHRDLHYLLDTGQGLTLPHNVKNGGVELQNIEAIFLSHGHFDHTGGLSWVLEQTGRKRVIAHPGVFEEHMTRVDLNLSTAPRYIGPPKSQPAYETEGAVFDFKQKTTEIAPGFHFITGYERNPKLTPGDQKLVIPQGNDYIADPINEDANLLLETGQGRS